MNRCSTLRDGPFNDGFPSFSPAASLAYCQTGSGKAFTIEGLEHRIARDLFDTGHLIGSRLWAIEQAKTTPVSIQRVDDIFQYSVTFLELLGKHAVDLVEPSKEVDAQRNEVAIHKDKVDSPLRARNLKASLLFSHTVASQNRLEEKLPPDFQTTISSTAARIP